MPDNKDLLMESYSQFQWSLSECGKYEINEMIHRKVDYLNKVHGLERDDILHHLFENYMSKKHYQKHDPAKTKLSTFIAHYTNWSLINLIRSYDTLEKNYREILFEDGPQNPSNGRNRCSLSYLEEIGHEGVVDRITPEDIYNGKELWNLMQDFFDKDDLLVILGFRDRRAEAERLSVDYYTYCKRLNRKVSAFKSLLTELGYL